MSTDLVSQLLSQGEGFISNLAPLLHESSKLWPYQRPFMQKRDGSRRLAAHDLLAHAASGIHLKTFASAGRRGIENGMETGSLSERDRGGTSLSLTRLAPVLIKTFPCYEETLFDASGGETPFLRCYLLACELDGLDAGSYYFHPADAKLISIKRGSPPFVPAQVFLEPEKVLDSQAWIVLCGSVRYDGVAGGERYYRDVLVAAGYATCLLIENAKRCGLCARSFLRFLDDPLALELGLDPAFEQPLSVVTISSRSEAARRIA